MSRHVGFVFGNRARSLLAFILLALLTACSQPAASPSASPESDSAVRTNQAGNVTIEARWQATAEGLVFAIVMDTHSVDLDGYDLAQLATLRNGQGQEARPLAWDAPKGGHHRSGTLLFPKEDKTGRPIAEPGAGYLELVIRDMAGVPERTFRWPL
ncbi:MAG: hypothetical protein HYX89_00790 [Chloroflexi bacterium]|nr:hypothetical protein [Chloroflexota bacterium]